MPYELRILIAIAMTIAGMAIAREAGLSWLFCRKQCRRFKAMHNQWQEKFPLESHK